MKIKCLSVLVIALVLFYGMTLPAGEMNFSSRLGMFPPPEVSGSVYPEIGRTSTTFEFLGHVFFGYFRENFTMEPSPANQSFNMYLYINRSRHSTMNYEYHGNYMNYYFSINGKSFLEGNNEYYFYWYQTSFDDYSPRYSGPFVSDTLLLFDLKIIFDNVVTQNLHLNLDVLTLPEEKIGKLYLILLDPAGSIFSAPLWEEGLSHFLELTFPPDLWIEKISLVNIDKLREKIPFKAEETYTLAIGAFDPENYELISNVATCTYYNY